jgi:tetratricopeptide (TPR) repeat protein
VQDKNVRIDLQPQFVLTYYEKLDRVREFVYYNKTVENFNERNALGWKLIMTNQEASLNEFQIEAHFASINEYSAKIEKDPGNVDYYFGRGIDFMLVQDFAEAINNFDKAIEIDPACIPAYFCRAAVRYKQLEYQEQANASQDELADALSIQFNLGNVAGQVSQTTSAVGGNKRDNLSSYTYEMILRDYNTVIQKDPSFTFAYFNRANLLCSQRDYKAAILSYNDAIRRDPEFAEAYFNRGLARLSQGDTKRGIADLSKAGELGIIDAYNIIKRMTE